MSPRPSAIARPRGPDAHPATDDVHRPDDASRAIDRVCQPVFRDAGRGHRAGRRTRRLRPPFHLAGSRFARAGPRSQGARRCPKGDGASHLRTFYSIILPLVTPILAVVGVLAFIGSINEFLMASVFPDPDGHEDLGGGTVRPDRRREECQLRSVRCRHSPHGGPNRDPFLLAPEVHRRRTHCRLGQGLTLRVAATMSPT